jgi:hypothetical protein
MKKGMIRPFLPLQNYVSISNLDEILSSRSKSCIRSDMKCAKKRMFKTILGLKTSF